jgi:MFS family permease
MAASISRRIARERGRASFFAFIASLPALAAIGLFIYASYRSVTEAEPGQFGNDGEYVILAFAAVFCFLFFIVARWTYDGVRSALTPQRVQAMWLRRFHSERGRFRTSRVVDRLSRYGVSALTLQDRDVQLSFEQRRNRLAPMFWLLFIPIALVVAWLMWNGWQTAQADIMDLEPTGDLRQAIGQVLGAMIVFIFVGVLFVAGFFIAILATVLLVMLIAAISGPVGAMFSRNRDDYKQLPSLLKRFHRGKRRGSTVLRISDANWRDAVTSGLSAADVAIIDLSDVSEHVAWEIAEAAKACTPSGLVFICRDDAKLSDAARAAVRSALGREPGNVARYPANSGASDESFSRDLREAIYNAADLRQAATH